MHMSIFKNKESFQDNYNNIYDVKKRKLYLTLFILLMVLLKSIFQPAPATYLQSVSIGYKLKSVDNLYDYFIPLSSAFIIIYAFFEDYNSNAYEMITFLNRKNFNYTMLYRWSMYISIFCLGSFVSGLIYYRSLSFLDINNVLLSIRFIPNILFLSSMVLLVTTLFKNIYAAILALTSYYCIDFLSSANIFKVLALGVHSNNFYYVISPEYYFGNRLLLTILSFIFLFISCKISAKT